MMYCSQRSRHSWFHLFLVLISPVFLSVSDVRAETPTFEPVKAEHCHARDGIGNVLAKLRDGKTVRIAYLGGSITAANGWRVKSLEWFRQAYPEADVSEIHAAIGGTGSDLGVFRLQRDALQYKPDLLFVEFAVNDGGAQPEQIWRAMEGIVRQTWAADPNTDICFVYTFRVGYENDLRNGFNPRAASAMELLADHYAIPSINFAKKIVELEATGSLIFKSDEPASEGVVRFSSDGVHPLDEGHQIYADLVADAVTKFGETSQPMDHASKLATTFVEDHWQAAKMIPVDQSMLTPEWKQLGPDDRLAKSFSKRLGTIWETTQPGSKLSFQFRGSVAKLYDLLGTDGGQVIVTVDGKKLDRPLPRFDSYCTYHRIATLGVAMGVDPDEVHTVIVEVDSEQPDRQSVAFRLKDPETELKSPKYQGTCIRVGQIQIIGDIVP
ncbi:SGNH/GDSL hydrolase family protein [Aporhodopirellula aestuarii]|uniref:SGNH/GDSL hydrolase family protein n=1 Tax=Aporhodopirellula aestuarii TaxID=2950107 RepID=A0ABT0U9V1_9BACT|nr:SGNH/GDSL hydrolase family protein [Aporhodopirellula aestuarii]MCM2373651.1 SGNH/GDSL hydrolase family protein [Aporhodopirellula aestuarii]